MSEQEAQDEAERRIPIIPAGVTDTRNIPSIERERKRFVEGAEWQASRKVVAAPADAGRSEQCDGDCDSMWCSARGAVSPESEGKE